MLEQETFNTFLHLQQVERLEDRTYRDDVREPERFRFAEVDLSENLVDERAVSCSSQV